MKVLLVDQCNSSPAPKEYYELPEIKESRPKVGGKTGYVETSLQQLDGFPKSVILVQWMGAKNGLWYPASEVFRIFKK
jgi:hypothetical protein